jgi:hypothetical protein
VMGVLIYIYVGFFALIAYIVCKLTGACPI